MLLLLLALSAPVAIAPTPAVCAAANALDARRFESRISVAAKPDQTTLRAGALRFSRFLYWVAIASRTDAGFSAAVAEEQRLTADQHRLTAALTICDKVAVENRLPPLPSPPAGDANTCAARVNLVRTMAATCGPQAEVMKSQRAIQSDLEQGRLSCSNAATAWVIAGAVSHLRVCPAPVTPATLR